MEPCASSTIKSACSTAKEALQREKDISAGELIPAELSRLLCHCPSHHPLSGAVSSPSQKSGLFSNV